MSHYLLASVLLEHLPFSNPNSLILSPALEQGSTNMDDQVLQQMMMMMMISFTLTPRLTAICRLQLLSKYMLIDP
jgi:hypothetical protein